MISYYTDEAHKLNDPEAARLHGPPTNLETYTNDSGTEKIECSTSEREEYEDDWSEELESADIISDWQFNKLKTWLRENAGLRIDEPTIPNALTITPGEPATVYYCKANIKTGTTVILLHRGQREALKGVRFHNITGEMLDGNSTGVPKRSGARCVFNVTAGTIERIK